MKKVKRCRVAPDFFVGKIYDLIKVPYYVSIYVSS